MWASVIIAIVLNIISATGSIHAIVKKNERKNYLSVTGVWMGAWIAMFIAIYNGAPSGLQWALVGVSLACGLAVAKTIINASK